MGILAQARKAPWGVFPKGKVIFLGDDMNIQRFDWAYCSTIGAGTLVDRSWYSHGASGLMKKRSQARYMKALIHPQRINAHCLVIGAVFFDAKNDIGVFVEDVQRVLVQSPWFTVVGLARVTSDR